MILVHVLQRFGTASHSISTPPVIFMDNTVGIDDPSTFWVVVSLPHPCCKLNRCICSPTNSSVSLNWHKCLFFNWFLLFYYLVLSITDTMVYYVQNLGLYFIWTSTFKNCGMLFMVWLCVPPPPKFTCWNPNAQGDGISRWGLWEVMKSWGWNPHEWD